MENLDSRLLRNQEEEKDAAKKLKEEKRGAAGGEKGDEAGAEGEPRSFPQRVQAAKQVMNIRQRAEEKLKEKVAAPARQATNNLLRWAWGVLIPSFGLSLIYINTHVFLRWVFPDLFCKLGDEWMPKIVGTGEHTSKNVAGTAFGIIEIMGLLFLDLLALFLILAVLGLLVMIATWLGASWWEKLGMIYDALKSMGWATIQALVSLFS